MTPNNLELSEMLKAEKLGERSHSKFHEKAKGYTRKATESYYFAPLGCTWKNSYVIIINRHFIVFS